MWELSGVKAVPVSCRPADVGPTGMFGAAERSRSQSTLRLAGPHDPIANRPSGLNSTSAAMLTSPTRSLSTRVVRWYQTFNADSASGVGYFRYAARVKASELRSVD